MRLSSIVMLSAALLTSTATSATEYKRGGLRVSHVHARATVPGQPTGAAYIDIENTGKSVDTLVSLKSPIAKNAALHTMSMAGNVMRMREVPGLDIPPSTRIAMTSGNGYHIMLTGLKSPLKVGEKFPMTLIFKNAGKMEVMVVVEVDARSRR